MVLEVVHQEGLVLILGLFFSLLFGWHEPAARGGRGAGIMKRVIGLGPFSFALRHRCLCLLAGVHGQRSGGPGCLHSLGCKPVLPVIKGGGKMQPAWSRSCAVGGFMSSSMLVVRFCWLRVSPFFLKNSLSGGEPLVAAPLQTLVNTWLVMMRSSPSRFDWHPQLVHGTFSPFCHRQWLGWV